MRIKKYWMMFAIALVSLCTISCGGDDKDENEYTPTNTNTKNSESQKFVGKWVGRGPISSGTTIKSIPQGTWQFNTDGTYYWKAFSNISGYDTSNSGNWHYNPQTKVLITDSHLSINWQILDISENSWTGIMSYGSTSCTYRRVE